ncbi:MAG TPA: LamG-like jellyroll fold domain-containing protein [Acidimicrobiales bacterium]|jgi:beta-glucanase (GH16 family)|nr:LamG-like jellyroll fold domain-containing protein [Acidimicrobiales bacterium]
MTRRYAIPACWKLLGLTILAVATLVAPLLQAVAAPASASATTRTHASVLPVGSAGGANLVFSDEFNTTSLNSSNWQTCAWWSSTTCSITTNNEEELYTKNNVAVGNGALDLQARHQDAVAWNGSTYHYTSGMVSSGGRSGQIVPGFSFTYGYTEARVKVPKGQGLWPAFWLLPTDYSWPPEIDAMEILGSQPNVVNMTYHYLNPAGAAASVGGTWTGPDFSAGWHTFGVDWEPSAIVWYVDGVERFRFTDASAITSKAMYLVLNLAVGGNWPGPADATTPMPSDYLVDYVRVWDRFGTPAPAGALTGYAAGVAADGPAAYWRLGETSGTLANDSVGNNTGIYNGVTEGTASLLTSDATNGSASFDGTDDVVSIPSSAGLSPTTAFSVEAWVRPAALPAAGSFNSIVTKAESYSLQFDGPQLEFTTMQNGTRRRVKAPVGAVAVGQRYHVVGTYDGTTQRLYINGALVASGAFSGSVSVNGNAVKLGSWDGNSEYLNGTLDEPAVYGKVLTATQITNHYNAGVAVS